MQIAGYGFSSRYHADNEVRTTNSLLQLESVLPYLVSLAHSLIYNFFFTFIDLVRESDDDETSLQDHRKDCGHTRGIRTMIIGGGIDK